MEFIGARSILLPCCFFQDLPQQDKTSQTSQLTRTDARLKDHWRKLCDKFDAHQQNSTHILCYLTWKDLEKSLNESTGTDHNLKKQFDAEMSKWREVFRCILDVLFLSERNLPFRGSTTKLGYPNNGLFLGGLELLSGHNQVLKSHLNEAKNIKRMNLECKHTICHGVHKMSSLENVQKLFSMPLLMK